MDSKEDERILNKKVPTDIQGTVLLKQMQPLNGTSPRPSLMAQASGEDIFAPLAGDTPDPDAAKGRI